MDITQLVEQAQQGSKSDYGQIVRIYQRMAIMWAWQVLGDFHAAQDVAQDAFVIGFCKLDTLRVPAAFPGWLSEIVRRQALQKVRSMGRSLQLEQIPQPETDWNHDPPWLEKFSVTDGCYPWDPTARARSCRAALSGRPFGIDGGGFVGSSSRHSDQATISSNSQTTRITFGGA